MDKQISFRDRYGPWAVVAGASVGLGAAFARQLAGRGLNLVLFARRGDRLRALADDLRTSYGVEVWPVVLDLTVEDVTEKVRVPMAERGRGGILLMSSLSAFQGSALIANYAATKAYNLALAEGLSYELGKVGVDVLVCCAGATRTPGYEASQPAARLRIAPAAMDPDDVVSEALNALGKRQVLIPGRSNRWTQLLLSRLLPRSVAVRIMGRTMNDLYGDP